MTEFEKKFKIPVYDTDFQGRLSIISLFNYIQDIAAEHAELLHFGREDLQSKNQFWILSRLYIEIKSLPAWGETIILRTWPRGTEGIFALREIDIMDEKGESIAGATTSWVIVDSSTRRPVRPGEMLVKFNMEYPVKQAASRSADKVALTPSRFPSKSAQFSVKASDLDVNLHVNNVKYLQWAYNTRSVQFLSTNDAVSVEVNYLAEAVERDQIILLTQDTTEENNCSLHSVIKSDSEKELCRILICWHQSSNKKVL